MMHQGEDGKVLYQLGKRLMALNIENREQG
jgi:hypothetical protein